MAFIETRGLTKRYADGVVALDRLDLRVEAGKIYALLGPNGAGKTTTISLLLNYIPRTCLASGGYEVSHTGGGNRGGSRAGAVRTDIR
jgi:ABC-type multidrug transport system ATPase subunit